jgi:hypothetical protein
MIRNTLGILVLISLALFSCSKAKINNAIDGIWSMDTIYYRNHDVKLCLSSNIIEFDSRNSQFPVTMNNCGSIMKNSYSRSGEIEIINSEFKNDTIPFRIRIKTDNEIFSGVHKIVFYKDEYHQLLKMEIFSDDLYVVCRKGLFNYNNNIKLMNDLEDLSWTTRPVR